MAGKQITPNEAVMPNRDEQEARQAGPATPGGEPAGAAPPSDRHGQPQEAPPLKMDNAGDPHRPAAATNPRPLLHMMVRTRLRQELRSAKRGKGAKAKAIPKDEQAELYETVTDAAIDAAASQAEGNQLAGANVGGPFIDFITSPQMMALIQKIVEILLAALLA